LYLIIIVNYILLIRIRKLTFNIYFAGLILGLFIHGVVTNSIIGIPPNFMLSQIIGIVIIGSYYYNFIPLYEKEELLTIYTKLCLCVAIIGYPMYFSGINLNDGRLQSVFKEPAHYVIVVLPACYYFLKSKKHLPFFVIFGTLILSNSSIGYFGCGLMFLIPNVSYKRLLHFLAILPFVFGTFYFIYSEFSFFKMRVDDTYKSLNAINSGKYKEYTNLSSYALLSNIFIAKNNILDHPFGSGIGSHVYMHKTVYIHRMKPPQYLVIQHAENTNASDADSMFVRIVSEMGILGFVLVIVLLSLAFKVFSKDLILAQGIVIYILLKLFRDGHYFAPEFYFFIWLLYFYIKDYDEKKQIN
jgi:O-Antigen ligase